MHTHTNANTHTRTHALPHTHTHTHAHAYRATHPHAHARAHTHAHAHAAHACNSWHTHTYTLSMYKIHGLALYQWVGCVAHMNESFAHMSSVAHTCESCYIPVASWRLRMYAVTKTSHSMHPSHSSSCSQMISSASFMPYSVFLANAYPTVLCGPGFFLVEYTSDWDDWLTWVQMRLSSFTTVATISVSVRWWSFSAYYLILSLGTHLKTASRSFASKCRFEPVNVPAVRVRTNRAFCKAIRLFLMESLK